MTINMMAIFTITILVVGALLIFGIGTILVMWGERNEIKKCKESDCPFHDNGILNGCCANDD